MRTRSLQIVRMGVAAGFALNACSAVLAGVAPRETVSLDGEWQITDGKAADEVPVGYYRTVPVPGLVNLAKPAFKDVDQFISRENMARRITYKLAPDDWLQKYWVGKVPVGG